VGVGVGASDARWVWVLLGSREAAALRWSEGRGRGRGRGSAARGIHQAAMSHVGEGGTGGFPRWSLAWTRASLDLLTHGNGMDRAVNSY